jgi:hypothetical protein
VEEVRKRWAARICAGWSGRGEFRRGARGELRCREEEEEETGEEMGFGSGFIGVHCFVEERERESGHGIRLRTAGGAGVPFGCGQPLGTGGPTWLSRGLSPGAARAVEGGVGRHVEQDKGGADLQVLGGRPAAEITRAAESRGDRGLQEDDGGPRCNITEMQGPYYNDLITFKPVLKWK